MYYFIFVWNVIMKISELSSIQNISLIWFNFLAKFKSYEFLIYFDSFISSSFRVYLQKFNAIYAYNKLCFILSLSSQGYILDSKFGYFRYSMRNVTLRRMQLFQFFFICWSLRQSMVENRF
jgi:hypothetical protein